MSDSQLPVIPLDTASGLSLVIEATVCATVKLTRHFPGERPASFEWTPNGALELANWLISDQTDPIPQLTRANDLTIVRHHPGGLVQLSCQFNGMDMMESIFHTADARRVAVALETTSEAATELSNLFEQDGFGFG